VDAYDEGLTEPRPSTWTRADRRLSECCGGRGVPLDSGHRDCDCNYARAGAAVSGQVVAIESARSFGLPRRQDEPWVSKQRIAVHFDVTTTCIDNWCRAGMPYEYMGGRRGFGCRSARRGHREHGKRKS
jgi:hypothetical protein